MNKNVTSDLDRLRDKARETENVNRDFSLFVTDLTDLVLILLSVNYLGSSLIPPFVPVFQLSLRLWTLLIYLHLIILLINLIMIRVLLLSSVMSSQSQLTSHSKYLSLISLPPLISKQTYQLHILTSGGASARLWPLEWDLHFNFKFCPCSKVIA